MTKKTLHPVQCHKSNCSSTCPHDSRNKHLVTGLDDHSHHVLRNELSLTIVGAGQSLHVHFQCLSFGRKGDTVVIVTLWTSGMEAQSLDENYSGYSRYLMRNQMQSIKTNGGLSYLLLKSPLIFQFGSEMIASLQTPDGLRFPGSRCRFPRLLHYSPRLTWRVVQHQTLPVRIQVVND